MSQSHVTFEGFLLDGNIQSLRNSLAKEGYLMTGQEENWCDFFDDYAYRGKRTSLVVYYTYKTKTIYEIELIYHFKDKYELEAERDSLIGICLNKYHAVNRKDSLWADRPEISFDYLNNKGEPAGLLKINVLAHESTSKSINTIIFSCTDFLNEKKKELERP